MSHFLTRHNLSKRQRKHSSTRRQFTNPLEALAKANMPIRATLQTAQLFANISQELGLFLQKGIGSYCHVVRLDSEQLILAVPNAAIASKLRQSAPSIATYLAQKGYVISRINIKVSAELQRLHKTPLSQAATNAHQVPSPRAKQCHQAFKQFVEQFPDSPLAPTIHKILGRNTSN